MNRFYSFLKDVIRKPVVLSVLVTVLASFIYNSSPFLSKIDLIARDFLFQVRHIIKKEAGSANQLVLVAVDDSSTQREKLKWPWPRSVYADAIRKINALSPKVIGFDFVFQGEDTALGSDDLLKEALASAGNVIIASYLDHQGQAKLNLEFQEVFFQTNGASEKTNLGPKDQCGK